MKANSAVDFSGNAQASVEETELDLLLEGLYRVFGYDFRQYARSTVKRRLGEIMRSGGFDNLSQVQGRALRDPAFLDSLVSSLSIQASGFFRDPKFYAALRRKAVPILRTYPFVRVWHAGCAGGEEVYSTAIVLQEEGLLGRCHLYATDINDEALKTGALGVYSAAAIKASAHHYVQAGGSASLTDYFDMAGREASVRPDWKKRITFVEHNLATDQSFNDFHLILCRNVLIYFSKPLQDRVHKLLYDSLVHLGIIGLGANETMHLTPKEKHYRPLDEQARLYRRID